MALDRPVSSGAAAAATIVREVDRAAQLLAGGSSECAAHTAGQRQAAQELCHWARGQGWPLLASVLSCTEHSQVRLWCLAGLHDLVSGESAINAADSSLHAQLLEWARSLKSEVGLRNKLATVYVCVIRRDYPTRWPDAFSALLPHCEDEFVLRVLSFLGEDCAENPQCKGLLCTFAQQELPSLLDWAAAQPSRRASRHWQAAMASLAAFLPQPMLLDFRFPATVERFALADTALSRAGSLCSSAWQRAALRMELLRLWPCAAWLESYRPEEEEPAAELCCTIAETLWSALLPAPEPSPPPGGPSQQEQGLLQAIALEALRRLLPACLGFFRSADFRVADSLEEFFSLVFTSPGASGAPAEDLRLVLVAVLDASFVHLGTPGWLREPDVEPEHAAARIAFQRDLRRLLRRMHRFDEELFEAHLRQRLASTELFGRAQALEGALRVLCQVGVRKPKAWKDVVDGVLRWPLLLALPPAAHAAPLEVLLTFAGELDGRDLPAALEFVVRCAGAPPPLGNASLACGALQRLAELRARELGPLAEELQRSLGELMRPDATLSDVGQQALYQALGALCAVGGRQQLCLRRLLAPQLALSASTPPWDGKPGTACRAIRSVASFLTGLGPAADQGLTEWAEIFQVLRQAPLRFPADDEVAAALDCLAWATRTWPG